jgi:hypothetical protein
MMSEIDENVAVVEKTTDNNDHSAIKDEFKDILVN